MSVSLISFVHYALIVCQQMAAYIYTVYACCRGCVQSLMYMISQWKSEHNGGCVAWVYTSITACGCEFIVGQRTVKWIMKCILCLVTTVPHGKLFNWIQELNKGRHCIRDREHPGRPAEVSAEATVQYVEQIIRYDRHVSIDDVARAVGYSHWTAYNIMHE